MPVTTAYSPISYSGNGVTNAFPVTFQFQLQTDLVVSTLVVATNVSTPLVLGTDYTVSPTLNSPASTGTVITTVPVATGSDLVIARSTPVTQLTTWVPNDPNLSTSTMNAVDKLTMEMQEIVGGGGTLPDSALGNGTSSTDTFLRGGTPRAWSNTLIGPAGPGTVPVDAQSLLNLQDDGVAAMRVLSGATDISAYRFGHDGATNAWDMQWGYDPVTGKIGWYAFGGSALGTFDSSGNVDITGAYTGHADASLIDSGTIALARLGTNSPASNLFLNGANQWSVPAGGGGVNTTTTGTFVIAAVSSSQTVPVTATTGIANGTYLQISDGTHTIIGHVTNIASLNLTVVTDSIVLGSAGNTMASGAAVQLSTVPGQNTVLVSDLVVTSTPVTNIHFLNGSSAGAAGKSHVTSYISSVVAGLANIQGYLASGVSIAEVVFNPVPAFPRTLVADASSGVPHETLTGAAGTPLRITTNGLSADFGQLQAALAIAAGTITPALFNATNSLTNGYVPSYDSGTGHFTWVANGGSIPGGGDAGKFFRGDNTFTNVLDISADSGAASIGLTLAQGDVNGDFGSTFGGAVNGSYAFWIMQKKTAGVWGTPATFCNYQIGSGIDAGVLSVGAPWVNPDGTNVERFYANGLMRTNAGLRSVYGPLSLIYEIAAPASPLTIDLVNGAYQRISSLGLALTIALADTTPLPTSVRYESELTLELNLSSHDITWPGTITWANGGTGPTIANSGLNATGINIIKLIRRQGQTQWIGYENPNVAGGGTGTVTSITAGSGLSGGTITTSGTIAIGAAAITSTMFQSGAVDNNALASGIQISKLLGAGSSTTTFLRNDGNWAVPPGTGGGGGGISPNSPNTWTATQTYTSAGVIVSAALNTFSNTNTFTPPSWTNTLAGTGVSTGYTDGSSGAKEGISSRIFDNHLTADYIPISSYHVTYANRSNASGNDQHYFDIRGTAGPLGNFSIADTAITQSANVNGDSRDGIWLNSWGPCIVFQSTPATYTTDSTTTTHNFASGTIRGGEVNYGNAWSELGFVDDRGLSSFYCGIEFFPDWLPGTIADFYSGSPPPFQKFNAQWAIAIGGAAPGTLGAAPKNWIGLLVGKDGIAPGGLALNLHGGTVSTTTTGTFTMAAVGASQTVSVTSTSGISATAGSLTGLQISDGTHTIQGHVTNIASLNLTVVTDSIIAGTAGNTMASAAIVTTAMAAAINLQNYMGTGINFAGSAGGAPVGTGGGTAATFTNTGAPAITLADDQSIKFGSIWLRGHSSTLQYSTNGTSWSTLTLP